MPKKGPRGKTAAAEPGGQAAPDNNIEPPGPEAEEVQAEAVPLVDVDSALIAVLSAIAGLATKVDGVVARVASVEAPWSPRGVGGGAASGWPIVRLVLDAPRNALLLAGAKVCVVAEGDEEGAVKEGKKSFQVS
jgi:hypothetical protein